jgi:hypothetical protein
MLRGEPMGVLVNGRMRGRIFVLALVAPVAGLGACFTSTSSQTDAESDASFPDAPSAEDAPAADATTDVSVAPTVDGGDAASADATVTEAADAGSDVPVDVAVASEASPDVAVVPEASPDVAVVPDASPDVVVVADAAPDTGEAVIDASVDSTVAPLLVASGAGYGGFALGADAIYWMATADLTGNLYRAGLDGGSPVILVAGTGGRVTVDSTNVYWGAQSGSAYAIYYLPLNADAGSTPGVLSSAYDVGAPGRLVVYAGNLYMSVSGGGVERFSTTPTANPATNHPVVMVGSAPCTDTCSPDLAVTPNGAFFTVIAPADAGGGIYSVPLSAEGGVYSTGNLVALSDNPVAVAADDTNVYWANAGPLDVNGTVLMANQLDAGTVTTIASGQGIPNGIAIDPTAAPVTVYWTDRGSNNVAFAPATSGAPVTVLATEQAYPVDIFLNATSVYWTDLNAGIYLLPKP